VVRVAVLDLCDQLGLPRADNRDLTIRELLGAQEVFLTSSCAGIRPVVRIERHAVADEKPGPVTRRIMQAYGELLRRECGLAGQGDKP